MWKCVVKSMHSFPVHDHWLIVSSDDCYDTDWIFRSTSSEVGQTSYMMMWRIDQSDHSNHRIKSSHTHMKPNGRIRIGYKHIWSVPISGFGCDCSCYDLIDVSYEVIQGPYQTIMSRRGCYIFTYTWSLLVVVIGVVANYVFAVVVWMCGWTASFQAFFCFGLM